jgi:carbon starvation protein CstA
MIASITFLCKVIIYLLFQFLGSCNQCLSPLKLWFRIPFMVRCTRYHIMWQTLSVTCDRSFFFSTDTLVSCTNKTNLYTITKILLKVALDTIHMIASITFLCKVIIYLLFQFLVAVVYQSVKRIEKNSRKVNVGTI